VTIRLDRMQQGLMQAFAGVASLVSFGHGQQPRGAGTLLSVTEVSGPHAHNQEHAFALTRLPPDEFTIRVTDAVDGQRVTLPLNGFRYHYDVDGDDTPTTIRDALLDAVEAGESGSVTPTADGADGIVLTADFLGGIWEDGPPLGSLEVDDGETVISGDAVSIREADELLVVNVRAYSKGREPRNGATAIANAAKAKLEDADVIAELVRYGVAVWGRGSVQPLSTIAGGSWETSAGFDLTLNVRSVAIKPVDVIETATAPVTAALPVGTATVSASVTAP